MSSKSTIIPQVEKFLKKESETSDHNDDKCNKVKTVMKWLPDDSCYIIVDPECSIKCVLDPNVQKKHTKDKNGEDKHDFDSKFVI